MFQVRLYYILLSVFEALWSSAGKGLISLFSCEVFCVRQFPIWCLGLSVVLDCIDSASLLLLYSYTELHIYGQRIMLADAIQHVSSWSNGITKE